MMLSHPHDLMHKATGWMLREGWQREPAPIMAFIEKHKNQMPRTMLRYAIEKMSPAERKRLMERK
jgi:3-methyladenine DNA glycosylase AlkD